MGIKENRQSGRIIYLDITRILATLAVMLIHISGQNYYKVDVSSSEWGVMNFCDGISRWAVAAFVMISGALFLRRTITIERIFRKNVLRIATAFLFWSAVYAVVGYDPDQGVKGLILDLAKGHYHMWFLYLIAGLYMIVPFMRRIAEDRVLTDYFIMLGVLFTFILPSGIQIISLFRPGYAAHLREITELLDMRFVVGYPVYYIMGYWLSSRTFSRRAKQLILVTGLTGFVMTVMLTAWTSQRNGSASEMFYDYLTLNVMLESVLVFAGARKLMEGRSLSPKAEKIILKLSKWSFGAFLVHPLFLKILRKGVHLNSLTFHPAVTIPLMLLLVAFLSFSVSAIIHRIPFLNKYIV